MTIKMSLSWGSNSRDDFATCGDYAAQFFVQVATAIGSICTLYLSYEYEHKYWYRVQSNTYKEPRIDPWLRRLY